MPGNSNRALGDNVVQVAIEESVKDNELEKLLKDYKQYILELIANKIVKLLWITACQPYSGQNRYSHSLFGSWTTEITSNTQTVVVHRTVWRTISF